MVHDKEIECKDRLNIKNKVDWRLPRDRRGQYRFFNEYLSDATSGYDANQIKYDRKLDELSGAFSMIEVHSRRLEAHEWRI